MKKPVVIGLAIAAIVAVIAGGTWWYQSRQDDGLTLYGNVDIRTVNISFRVGGRLASLNVDEGDAIKAGQVLGELDHAPYENALMQAKAGVSVAQAQYDLMLAGYRDEEIARPPPPSDRHKPPMTTRKTFITVSKDCGKAAPFPLTIWKTPAHRAIRRRQR